MYTAGGTKFIGDLKAARRVVYEKVLAEVADVAAVTTGVKEYCVSHLAHLPIDGQIAVADSVHQDLLALLASNLSLLLSLRDVLHHNIAVTKSLNTDSVVRTRKFGGRDVCKQDRAAVLAQRKEDPRTAEMMMKVVVDTGLVKGGAGAVLRRLEDMEPLLLRLWEAARERLRVEEGLYGALGGNGVVE